MADFVYLLLVFVAVSCKVLGAPLGGLNPYIVLLNDDAPAADLIDNLPELKASKDRIFHQYNHVFSGFAAHLDQATLGVLRSHPAVKSIHEDAPVRLVDVESNAPYNLAISSEEGELSQNQQNQYFYTPYYGDKTQTVWIFDTCINVNHQEFRQFDDNSRAYVAANYIQYEDAYDYNGHGTHIAGIVGAATYGIYKRGFMASVKVHSFSVNYIWNAIPASVPEALTAAAVDGTYTRSIFNDNYASNYGNCVDVFAPGSDIISTWIGSETATHVLSGTSMSAPHVSGIAAYLMAICGKTDPSEIHSLITQYSQKGLVQDTQGSPNLFANNGFFLNTCS